MSYLSYAHENKDEVQAFIQNVRQRNTADVVVTYIKKKTSEKLIMLDNYSNEMLEMDLIMNDAWQSRATLTRKRPEAYLILPGQEKALENLKTLGLTVETLNAEMQLTVEAYEVTDYFKDALLYEQVQRQEVATKVTEKQVTFPAGTAIVYLAQDKGNMAAEVLEPEGTNSFVSFDVISTGLNEELPVFRYMQSKKIN